ncbi:MAG TPA: O-antigen ligase family protein, partial [Streptosporangiaceae bacterium]|nr:O-antigen ligase family protein [Streptosporangiaceae bacterium]
MTPSATELKRPIAARLGGPRLDATDALSIFLFLLMLIPSDLVVGAFGAAGRPATLLAAILLAWYLLVKQHPDADLYRGRQPVRAASIGLCCSVLASYVSASRAMMSGTEINAANRGLILLAGWLGVMLIAADGVSDEDRLAVLLRRVVAGATIMAVIGFAEFVTGTDLTRYITIPGLAVHQQVTDLMTRAGLIRANSTAAQPLEFCAVLTMSLPLAIHYARYSRPGRRRLLSWLQVAVIAATIPMTVSRSGIFALIVIALILGPAWPARQRRRAYLALIAIPAALWLAAPGVLHSFTMTFGQLGTDTSTTSRASAWSLAAPFITAHPWFGQGLGTFDPQTYFYVDDQLVTSLIETGIIGLLAVLAVFASGWYVTSKVRKGAADTKTRDLGRSLMASLAAAFICFATFDVLSFSIASGLFFLITGCAGAAWRLTCSPGPASRSRPLVRACRLLTRWFDLGCECYAMRCRVCGELGEGGAPGGGGFGGVARSFQ